MSEPRRHAPRISVILAVGDVEDTIGREVAELASELRRRQLSFQIIAVGDGCHDTSMNVLRLLGRQLPELMVLGSARPGHAFRRAMVEARGDSLLLWQIGRGAVPYAIIGWVLLRLATWDAVVVRGRCIFAHRLRALPALLAACGRGDAYETGFERLASDKRLEVDIVGARARPRRAGLLGPVLRILSV
jgi:hypothetical protein